MPTLPPVPAPASLVPLVVVVQHWDNRGAAPVESWHKYAPAEFVVRVYMHKGTPESMLTTEPESHKVTGAWLDETAGRGVEIVWREGMLDAYKRDRKARAEGIAPTFHKGA